MGRELLLPQKKGYYSRLRTQQEIKIVSSLLPGFESFETFAASHEVFDIQNNIPILQKAALLALFNDGLANSPRYRVISKN